MDQRTKNITMYEAVHPGDDFDRIYVSRKWGGRGFTSVQDSVSASIQQEASIKKKARRKTDYCDKGW